MDSSSGNDVIRKSSFYLAFLLFVLIYGQVSGQERLAELEKLVENKEDIYSLKVSANGRWKVWQSVYERKPPILKIADGRNHNSLVAIEDPSQWQLVDDNDIVVRIGSRLEYRNLETGKIKEFQDVKAFEYFDAGKTLIVHYNNGKDNALEIYDRKLNLIQGFSNVIWIKVFEKKLAFVVESDGNSLMVFDSVSKNIEKVWSGKSAINLFHESDMKDNGWIVVVKEKEGLKTLYVGKDKIVRELSFDGILYFDKVKPMASSNEKAVYLSLDKARDKPKSDIDLWYSSDYNLTEHFRNVPEQQFVLWFPTENKVVKMDEKYNEGFAFGCSGLFLKSAIDTLKVDPYDKKAAATSFAEIFVYDSNSNEHFYIDSVAEHIYLSPQGNWITYLKNGRWVLYNVIRKSKQFLNYDKNAKPYFYSDNDAVWTSGRQLLSHDLKTQSVYEIVRFDGDVEILNSENRIPTKYYDKSSPTINLGSKLLLKVKKKDYHYSYYSWKNGKSLAIISDVDDLITDLTFNNVTGAFVWKAQNYNRSPVVMERSFTGKLSNVYTSAQPETTGRIKMKRLFYKGPNGDDLTALVYLPPEFKEDKKYPVAVFIYEVQNGKSNRYLAPSFNNGTGFNERLFLESGFMVMLPDIVAGKDGPGISALQCVNKALDKLLNIPQADSKKVGLIGHSFGGYETNFIATQSDRFAAYISGTSIVDIINTSFAFNYGTYTADYWRYEDGQFKLGDFVSDKEKYYRNNPLYYVHQIKSPMFLWAGTADNNVNHEQTRSMFLALRKYRKTAVALFYKDELHGLTKYNLKKDLSLRMIEWFEYFLMERNDSKWISKELKGAF